MIFTFKFRAIGQKFVTKNHETQRSQWEGVEIDFMWRYPTAYPRLASEKTGRNSAVPDKFGFWNIL